jgi:hypothetical protein
MLIHVSTGYIRLGLVKPRYVRLCHVRSSYDILVMVRRGEAR